MEDGRIVDRFQSLMNPGMRISSFIEQYTGISNTMLLKAASYEEVMAQFADFVQGHDLVAHNASFDQKFLDSELGRIGRCRKQEFACSMLISLRIYPHAPNHKLGTLVEYKRLQTDGIFHRALADAEMTAHLWLSLLQDIQDRYQLTEISFPDMRRLARTPKTAIEQFFDRHRRGRKAHVV